MKKREVALFCPSFLPYSQTFIYDEIRGHSENYNITVFCKDRQNQDRFPYKNYYEPTSKLSKIIYLRSGGRFSPFNRIIKESNFDLIHAHFGTGAVYPLFHVRKFNLPFVVTFHGNDVAALMGIQKYQFKRWGYYLKHKEIFERASLLLAASEELKALLIELGAAPEKVKVYRLGIDLSLFNFRPPSPSGPIKFIMIGRFTPKKGHLYALQAFNEVIKEGKKASLTLVGDGELEKELKAFVQENDLGTLVKFTGILSPEEVSQKLTDSDVLLAPSIVTQNLDRESGLIVVKEASAVGLPSIGTWHGGIHEIIGHEKTGFLVPERNVPELTKRMVQLIENPSLIREMGTAARKKMEEEYDLFDQVKKLEMFYEQAISPIQ